MQNWRRRASTKVIKIARRLIANTPIQQLSLTTAIYRRVFRLGYPSEEVTTAFRGTTLTVPTGDVTIVPGILGGFYEKIELDVFERLAALSSVVVDVGGNIGLYSCLAAARIPDGGRVVAFEPVPANLAYLRQNIEQNGFSGTVTVEATAVGEHHGEIDIFMVKGSIGTHSASAKNALDSADSISVPVVTLDGYVADTLKAPVDVLKIDVEGYEGHVLRGAAAMLGKYRPSLFIEFVPFHLANCGFPPSEFIDIILGVYDQVFLVDEPRATVRRCTRDDLLDASLNHKNVNLIAVDAAAHPDHLAAVESVSAALPHK
jgi:FkbM family methyltransferase